MLLQDIIEDDEIKLDWFFKASIIHDLVNVSVVQCVTMPSSHLRGVLLCTSIFTTRR